MFWLQDYSEENSEYEHPAISGTCSKGDQLVSEMPGSFR